MRAGVAPGPVPTGHRPVRTGSRSGRYSVATTRCATVGEEPAKLVETRRLELLTLSLQRRCSAN